MIVTARGGQNVALESYSLALTDMVRWGYQGLRNLRTPVGEAEARGIPALYRAARLRAEAVANLGLYCWRGRSLDRTRVENVWQARLFAKKPNDFQTRFGFWETVEESLAWRNNAYIWLNTDPSSGRVVEWWALHPDQVQLRQVNNKIVYRVQVAAGYVDPAQKGPAVYDEDESTILHIRGHGAGGQFEAPSPIQMFRDKLAGPIGRQRHESRMWRRGTAIQVGIEFPAGVTREQADQWREVWRAGYEGTEGETTAVVGGGATIKPIGMTATDAAFVDLANLTIQDASQIMGVPANLLGVTGAAGKESRVDLEQEKAMWLQLDFGPGLKRIEEALYSHDALFGPSALLRADASGSLGLYPMFDTDGFVRGDIATEATIQQKDVQVGILLADEARHMRGLDPLPNGMGKIPQIVPVGGAPNPNGQPNGGNNNTDNNAMSRQELERFAADLKQDVTERIAMRASDTHIHLPADLKVELEQQPIPPPVVHVSTPDIVVNVPEQPAPVVNVTVPEQQPPIVNVEIPETVVNVQPAPVTVVPADEDDDKPKRITVDRNRNGFITGMTIEEEN